MRSRTKRWIVAVVLVVVLAFALVAFAALDGRDTIPGYDSPLPPRSELMDEFVEAWVTIYLGLPISNR